MAAPVLLATGIPTFNYSPLTLASLVQLIAGGPVLEWHWVVTQTPMNLQDVQGNGDFVDGVSSAADPTLYTFMPGDYKFTVRARNVDGWCNALAVQLHAAPGDVTQTTEDADAVLVAIPVATGVITSALSAMQTVILSAITASTTVIQNYLSGTTVPAIGVLLNSTAAAFTAVASANADTALLAANAARKGFAVRNDANTILHLHKAAGAATVASFYPVPPGGIYEDCERWLGPVRGFWDLDGGGGAPVGNAVIREET